MAKRKRRPEQEHAEPVASVGGKRFRGAGAPAPSLRGRKVAVDADGHAVVTTTVIDMSTRLLTTRPLPPDPYTGEA